MTVDLAPTLSGSRAVSYVHINFTRYSETCCTVHRCPTCERPRRMLAQFQEWYGWTVTCAGCGDTWQDGEMLERPFCPGWRRKSIEHARKILAGIGIQA
jgi:hypothetical protein